MFIDRGEIRRRRDVDYRDGINLEPEPVYAIEHLGLNRHRHITTGCPHAATIERGLREKSRLLNPRGITKVAENIDARHATGFLAPRDGAFEENLFGLWNELRHSA